MSESRDHLAVTTLTPDVADTVRLLDRPSRDSLRIAIVAPPWIPVPPPSYGGTEAVVALLCEGLIARGHSVTLFAAAGSRSSAQVRTPLPASHPDSIGAALFESDHVAQAWGEIERGAGSGLPFDVVHDHSGFTAVAMANRLAAPVVHTLHGELDHQTSGFYQRHGHNVTLVAISRSQAASAPEGVEVSAVIGNPIAVREWPLELDKDDYLLWVGRMDPVKGAHRAVEAARRAGRRLVLAGPVQPGQETYFRKRVEPHVDGSDVQYLGDVGGAFKRRLFARASALLMPIRWREPFGMVMIEALACGTPVIAFPEGGAQEIVRHGVNGFLVPDTGTMSAAVRALPAIDPHRCRASVAERFDTQVVAAAYERVYRLAIHRRAAGQARLTADDPTDRLAGVR